MNAMKKSHHPQKGFTLIEILVVIGIVAILATIVLVALNPARQFAQARNSQRVSNVNAILNGIGQNIADNKGMLGGGCPPLAVGTTYDIAIGAGNIDLSCLVPTYLPSNLPYDPRAAGAHWTSATDYDTKYNVVIDANGRYTVSVPVANQELGVAISVTR